MLIFIQFRKELEVAQDKASQSAGVAAEAVTLAHNREQALSDTFKKGDVAAIVKLKELNQSMYQPKQQKQKVVEQLEHNDDDVEDTSKIDLPSIKRRRNKINNTS